MSAQRPYRVEATLTPPERDRIRVAAHAAGMTPTLWVREAALVAAAALDGAPHQQEVDRYLLTESGRELYRRMRQQAEGGDEKAKEWCETVKRRMDAEMAVLTAAAKRLRAVERALPDGTAGTMAVQARALTTINGSVDSQP